MIGLISFFLILLHKNYNSIDIHRYRTESIVVFVNRFSDLFIIVVFIVKMEFRGGNHSENFKNKIIMSRPKLKTIIMTVWRENKI